EDIVNKHFYVDAVGLGFCLIDARVFDRIEYPWFEYIVDVVDGRKREISEDFNFFLKTIEKGFKVLVDGGVICPHEANVQLLWNGDVRWVRP
ncbi:MAG: hypothetical protein ACXQS2_00410, partial [Methermicoccaceae archaeon]